MPRKRRVDVRDIMPDNRFGCPICSKFINNLMHGGKKSIAEGIFYDALDIMGKKLSGEDPHQLFLQAVENVKPILEVRSRRVGGANYQVPVEVRPSRRQALSFRWILESSRKRPEKTMAERLAAELLDAYNKVGVAIKKREDTHKMAEANRAFAHYRW